MERLKNTSVGLESLHAFLSLGEKQIEYSGFVGRKLQVKYFFACATASDESKMLGAIDL